jgi:hypothetical protein
MGLLARRIDQEMVGADIPPSALLRDRADGLFGEAGEEIGLPEDFQASVLPGGHDVLRPVLFSSPD